jgi:hypothetical protein
MTRRDQKLEMAQSTSGTFCAVPGGVVSEFRRLGPAVSSHPGGGGSIHNEAGR